MHHSRILTAMTIIIYTMLARASDPIRLPNRLPVPRNAAQRSVLTALNPGMPGRRDVTMGQAVTSALSPDGTTLLVLTSGYNREGNQRFDEYVFVFDVRTYPP